MLINYLPNFLAELTEIKIIMQNIQHILDELEISIDNIFNDFFISSVSINSIHRYENILSIEPKLSESIDIRRVNILSKYNKIPPFTIHSLTTMLNGICGYQNYSLHIDYQNFKLILTLSLKIKHLKQNILEFLNEIIPLNLSIHILIDYNKWQHISNNYWLSLSTFNWQHLYENQLT